MRGTNRGQDSFIVISSADFLATLKRQKKRLLFLACIAALLAFGYKVSRAPSYTANGVFRSVSQGGLNLANSKLAGAMGSLFSAQDEARILLNSYPVLEYAATRHHLQGSIKEKRLQNPFRKVWDNLLAEGYSYMSASLLPEAPLIDKKSKVLTEPLIAGVESAIEFSSLCYEGDFAEIISCQFIDERHFLLQGKRGKIEGELDSEIVLEGLRFTLKQGMRPLRAGERFTLTFIPMAEVVETLKRGIEIKPDKKKNGLLHISYSHGERDLAYKVVNAVMEVYELYLKDRSRTKIRGQLAYLNERKEEGLKELERSLFAFTQEEAGSVEKRGSFVTLEAEVAYLAKKQQDSELKISELLAEIHKIYSASGGAAHEIPKIVEELKERRRELSGSLAFFQVASLEEAKAMRCECLESIEAYELKEKECSRLLKESERSDADLVALAKSTEDSYLIEQVRSLKMKLFDKAHYSAKEKEMLGEVYQAQAALIASALSSQVERYSLLAQMAYEKLQRLNQAMLALLIEELEIAELELGRLASSIQALSERWMSNKKIHFTETLHHESIRTLIGAVEERNIAASVESMASGPLEFARRALVPDAPHLLLFSLLVALGCELLYFLALALILAKRGPSTHRGNLLSLGFELIEERDHSRLLFALIERRRKNPSQSSFCSLLVSSQRSDCFERLIASFEKMGERVVVVDFCAGALSPHSLDKSALGFEALVSEAFRKEIEGLKKGYSWLFFRIEASIRDLKVEALATLVDLTIAEINKENEKERLDCLDKLAERSLLILKSDQEIEEPPFLPVKECRALVDKLLANVLARKIT